jgi:hypothetical protein
MEMTLWVEQRGSDEVGGNVRGSLETISKNEEVIQQGKYHELHSQNYYMHLRHNHYKRLRLYNTGEQAI